jgi:hypothetical protein
LYLYADVRQARGLLEPLAAAFAAPRDSSAVLGSGGKAGRAGPILDRSEEIYACLYLPAAGASAGPPTVPAAELAVVGRWSPSLVSSRLDWSCRWVRHRPPPDSTGSPPYWSARREPLEVGSPAPGLLLASSGRPGALERMMARRLSPQAGPVERAREEEPQAGLFLAGAALYAFLPMLPSRIANRGEAGGGLPVRELWLAARRAQDQYELGALAALASPAAGAPSEPVARALTGLVRLAAASWLRKAGIPEVAARLRAMEIEMQAGGLIVRGLSLSEAELLALFQVAVEVSDAHRGN